MAGSAKKPKKRRIEGGGRVTPKGGPSAGAKRTSSSERAPEASTRYTPPTASAHDLPSPPWVPVLMFSLFGIGMLVIFLNYVSLLPGAVSNVGENEFVAAVVLTALGQPRVGCVSVTDIPVTRSLRNKCA